MSGYNYHPQNDPQNPQRLQHPQGPQQQAPAGQYAYSGNNGWEFYNGAWHPAQPAQSAQPAQPAQSAQPAQVEQPTNASPPPKKGGGKTALKVTALLLACSLAGFGGGFAAGQVSGGGNGTVLYQSADTGPAAQAAASGERTISDVAATAGQSVVSITTENMVADFFTGGRIVSGAGSGVIVSEDGYIITNHHVVLGARNVTVTLPDGSEHQATFVGSDATTDIAVIKIATNGLTPAVMGDSDTLQVGEYCMAIGNPMGTLGGTVTDGIISALNREINIEGNSMNLLQMSAAVSPGNSGGGLFSAKGELIGVVNAKSGSSEAENLGFAIPSNTARTVFSELIENGYVTGRPALGVTALTVENAQQAAEAGVSEPGVYISSVNAGSPAAKAGIQVGDRILAADGQEILQSTDLSTVIQSKEVGDSIVLHISRGGTPIEITATLAEMPRTS